MISYFIRLKEGFAIGAQKGFARSINRVFDILEGLDGAPGSGIKLKRNGDQWRFDYDGSHESGNVTGEGKVYHKAFDIKSISGTTVTIENCAWQIGSQYFTSATEPTVTAATGVLCAVINRETNAVTAAMDAEWSESSPELIPIALYKVSVTGSVVTVLFDMRGGTISLHE